jgi:hypothetical protein
MSKKLAPAVAEAFELAQDAPISGGFPGYGQIDLSELNLDQAKSLVENGFPYLVPKAPKTTSKSKEV